MRFSCGFPAGLTTVDHVRLAEELGYERAWIYDSPALYADVWMILALCAKSTTRIGLGPGVLVPALRHVMVTASALATLTGLAPGRVAAAIGSGFTGRLALGQRPSPWGDVADYIRALRSLLRGDTVDWDGSLIQMIHSPDLIPARPIEVPILIAAAGPKGMAVARQLGDGVFAGTPAEVQSGFVWSATMAAGTLLRPGESFQSERILDAAGPATAATFHYLAEFNSERLATMTGGPEWIANVASVPKARRHLEIHRGHYVALNEFDRRAMTPAAVAKRTLTGNARDVRRRIADIAARGATELAYIPAGPEIPNELRAFAEAVGLRGDKSNVEDEPYVDLP
jgi:5,10-methylenetetrahydromethanopterin reductase